MDTCTYSMDTHKARGSLVGVKSVAEGQISYVNLLIVLELHLDK